MHVVQHEGAFKQRIVECQKVIDRAATISRSMRLWPRVKGNRALRIQDCQVSYGASIPEMRLIGGDPIEECMSGFAPTGVFRRAAKPMKPRHHTAGRGLRQPECQLRRSF